MAKEGFWNGSSSISFIADGGANGLVTISSTEKFRVGQRVTIASNSISPISLEVKSVTSLTTLYLGSIQNNPSGNHNKNERTDLSAYTTADLAYIKISEQAKPHKKLDDIIQACFEHEPVLALRNMLVDYIGNPYNTKNPLPVQLSDGSINIETVNANLSVQLDSKDNSPNAGDVHDSIRIGDQNHEANITSNNELQVSDSTTHNDLIQLDTDLIAIEGSVSPGTAAVKSALIGAQYNNQLPTLSNQQQASLQIDPKGKLITNNQLPSGSLDIFGAQITATRRLQIDERLFRGDLNSIINLSTTSSGTGIISNGSAHFSTGTSVTAQAKGVSAQTTAYSAGYEVFAHFTAAFTAPTSASSYQRIGLYDDSNGFIVGYNGTDFGITIRNGGIDTFVNRTNWNTDTLTGLSGSLFTRNGVPESVDLAQLNIWRIRFGWLGSAPIIFEIMSPDGSWLPFHMIRQPNSSTIPSVTNPNLPITVDVNKTSSDSTDLIIHTACWGAGVTSTKETLEDPQTGQYLNIDSRNEIRTANSLMLIGNTQDESLLDTNMWTATTTGSGTNVVGGGMDALATGSTANSSSSLYSKSRARFIPGTVNAFLAAVRLQHTSVANNIRRWGAYDSDNGLFFQIDGGGFQIGIRSAGIDTIITNFNGSYRFLLDTKFHTYEIQYTTRSALFFQDGNLIHEYISKTTALSATAHHKLGFENTNSGGGATDTTLYMIDSCIARYGEANARPRYFHPIYTSLVQINGMATAGRELSLSVNISPTIAGHLIVVFVTVMKKSLSTITDSLSQTYSLATSINDGTNYSYIYYVENTAATVDSITITPASNAKMSLIIAEYSNIKTTGALDQTAIALNSSTNSFDSGLTAPTTQGQELLVGVASDISNNHSTFVAGTSWTSLASVNASGSHGRLSSFMEEKYVASTGVYAATGTDDKTSNIFAGIATFKVESAMLSGGFATPNAPTIIAVGAGTLRKVVINSLGTTNAKITFYDNITDSGNIIAVLSLTANIGTIAYDLDFSNGLTMVANSATGDFTVVYD